MNNHNYLPDATSNNNQNIQKQKLFETGHWTDKGTKNQSLL